MELEFEIGKKPFCIESSETCFVVGDGYRIGEYKGAETKSPKNPTYHATLEHAFEEVVSRCHKKSNVKTLEELVVEIRNIKKEIAEIFKMPKIAR